MARIVFDLDGTLIDSAASLQGAAAAMMADLGLAQPDVATVSGMVGNGVPPLVARCLTWAGADPALATEGERRFRDHYDADPVTGVDVFAGVPQMLVTLAQGGLRLGVCTNKPEAPTATVLRALSLGPFDAVVGGDTLPQRKPDPAPLLHCQAQLGPPVSQTLFVGDSTVDAQTAQAAGMDYAHVRCGYQNGALDQEPTVMLRSAAELSAVLSTE